MNYNIYFVCDGGMGSSALGASLLQQEFKKNGCNNKVKNCSIQEIPREADIVICHTSFYEYIKNKYESVQVFSVEHFTSVINFERIVKHIMMMKKQEEILSKDSIVYNLASTTSDQAIVDVGEMLLKQGYIEEPYIKGMLARDHALTTYIGNDLAIPHGEYEVKDYVKKTGLAVRIYPDGIDWNGNHVRIVIGIAAKDDDHMSILQNIAMKLCEMDVVHKVVTCQDIETIHQIFTQEEKQ